MNITAKNFYRDLSDICSLADSRPQHARIETYAKLVSTLEVKDLTAIDPSIKFNDLELDDTQWSVLLDRLRMFSGSARAEH